jgi:hypothetical protein
MEGSLFLLGELPGTFSPFQTFPKISPTFFPRNQKDFLQEPAKPTTADKQGAEIRPCDLFFDGPVALGKRVDVWS